MIIKVKLVTQIFASCAGHLVKPQWAIKITPIQYHFPNVTSRTSTQVVHQVKISLGSPPNAGCQETLAFLNTFYGSRAWFDSLRQHTYLVPGRMAGKNPDWCNHLKVIKHMLLSWEISLWLSCQFSCLIGGRDQGSAPELGLLLEFNEKPFASYDTQFIPCNLRPVVNCTHWEKPNLLWGAPSVATKKHQRVPLTFWTRPGSEYT